MGGTIVRVSKQGIERFFHQYGRALSAGDLETIVGYFAPPSIIVDDSSTTLIVDRKELLQYFNGIEERYQALGAFTATASVGAIEQLSPTLWLVDVRWDSFVSQVRRLRWMSRHTSTCCEIRSPKEYSSWRHW